MAALPDDIVQFLGGKRFAVAGVSRQPGQAANAVFRKFRDIGRQVFAVNPNAAEVESVRC
jgi:predicted CoA-binding protein